MKRCLSIVLLALACHAVMPAGEVQHIVPAAELDQSLANAAEARRQNEADLQRLVSNAQVEKAALAAGIDPEQVRQAVPQLDDETLAELADRARSLEDDVAGGFISGIILTLLLILLLAVLISVYVLD